LRSLLVIGEVAISLMLLVGAGLLIRSFVRLQQVSPGFEPDGVISLRVGPSAHLFKTRDEALAHYEPIARALDGVPGVQSRGGVSALPFTSSVGWGGINVEGWTPRPGEELQVDRRSASSDYFRAMRIPLRQGRFFTEADTASTAAPVAIVDQKFAQRFWPAGDAVGKHLWNDPAQKMTIVGVVGTVKQYGLDIDGRIVVYSPSAWGGYQVARTSGDPAAVARDMTRTIHDLDPTMTVFDVQTMAERMSSSLARQRFSTLMLGAFAAFALLLAVVGVYGVMAHLVAQGTHDIGVRMALGAGRGSILMMILRHGFALAGTGAAIGLAGAAALSRVMASLLFGISATDLVTFAVVPALLMATAMLAGCVPARRATRVDPVIALRDE
jgi:predicted permease